MTWAKARQGGADTVKPKLPLVLPRSENEPNSSFPSWSILIPPAGDFCGTRLPPWQVKHLVSVPRDRIYYENQNSALAPTYIFENRRKDIAFMAELCGFHHAAIVERKINRPILIGRQYDFVCRKSFTFIPSKC
jgi:hypothetical protein